LISIAISDHQRGKADMSGGYTDLDAAVVPSHVYAPQDESQFLIDIMDKTGLAQGSRVADLCTGIVAVAASKQGASQVTAFDICPRAAHYARSEAAAAGVDGSVHLGSSGPAVEFGSYDLVVCNPPDAPHDPSVDAAPLPPYIGPAQAFDAGSDGRLVLDPPCAPAPESLDSGGMLLLVQSESAQPRTRLADVASAGLDADVVAYQRIPFGPVLTSRAEWLEESGRLDTGRREKELLVIRGTNHD
jgi:release factor glutamine methyltransferase